jgi:hypothetical protein
MLQTLTLIRALGPVDIKNIRRDPLLIWAPLGPLALALLLRAATPSLTTLLADRLDFDLVPYYPLLMSTYLLLAPALAGFMAGFLLLDERDDRTLLALLVSPVAPGAYLAYRLGLPLALGMVMTLIGYPIAGLTDAPLAAVLGVAALGACVGPILALVLAAFAENKVAGFALMKLANGVTMLPIVAYFFDESPWQIAAGIAPTYWPLKAYWQAAAGEPWLIYLAVGVVVNALTIAWLLRRFRRALYG